MSNQFGPSQDCIVCGQAVYPNDIVTCYGCNTLMCKRCRKEHNCHDILENRREEFIHELSDPICEVLSKFKYPNPSESRKEGKIIFDFVQTETAPAMILIIEEFRV